MTITRKVADTLKYAVDIDRNKAANTYVNATLTIKTNFDVNIGFLNAQKASNTYVNSILTNSSYEIGDIVATNSNPETGWLRCDGYVYSQSSYPTLFSKVGLLVDTAFTQRSTPYIADSMAFSTAYGNGTYVIGGLIPSGTLILTSPDGINWTQRTTTAFSSNNVAVIIFANGLFVAGATNGYVATSPDGITWTYRGAVSDPINSITYANGTYVIAADNGKIFTSTNLTSWSSRVNGFGTSPVKSVTYGNGLFVAVGSNSKLATSLDGVTWSQNDIPTAMSGQHIWSVTFANETFIAVGSSGKIASSSDGTVWTERKSNTNNVLINVSFGANVFLAVGSQSTVIFSADGKTWATLPMSSSTVNLNSITYGNGIFLLCGSVASSSTYAYTSPIYSYNASTEFITPNYVQDATYSAIPHIIKAL